ncbi:hypothetical protein D5R40_15885 [Okeania hirsuta]|uniref:Uncharacterized protein n=2 Tax=Microcoleaceae TaxID=1892252 RepID=A0A3N6PBB7_9CYAN|nr:hypothetical protein D4Z78_10085 [Okeania hirsuta]RQH40862.1 hypothetical protein D5R40_15885 [Okeania hirsuta]
MFSGLFTILTTAANSVSSTTLTKGILVAGAEDCSWLLPATATSFTGRTNLTFSNDYRLIFDWTAQDDNSDSVILSSELDSWYVELSSVLGLGVLLWDSSDSAFASEWQANLDFLYDIDADDVKLFTNPYTDEGLSFRIIWQLVVELVCMCLLIDIQWISQQYLCRAKL